MRHGGGYSQPRFQAPRVLELLGDLWDKGLLLATNTRQVVEGERFPARIVQIDELEVDPAVWGLNFPRQYDSWLRTRSYGTSTPYGSSEPFDKLEANPFRRMAWAGFPFELEYNEDRGH